jgi:uncharacterized protein YqgC (DUF456 family)
MLVGVIGTMIPGVPGTSLVVVAIAIWGILQGFSQVAIALAVALVVLLCSVAIDLLATYWGAKQAGASKWGQYGAILGFFLGLFGLLPALPFGGPILGMIVGPFVGALAAEFIYSRKLWRSVKASIGILVGTIVGNLIQGALALASVIVFVATTWPQVMG